MKVVQTVYGDASGGRWQAMLNTYEALESQGHEGIIVYGSDNQKQKIDGYRSWCLNNSGFYDPIAAVKLALWLRHYKPDVVIAHSGRAVHLFKNAILLARIKCPVIAMNHSHNVKRTVRADGFIHITPHVAQRVAEASVQKNINSTAKPQAVISNLIHLPTQPSVTKAESKITTLGIMTRLVEYKGTHLAIDGVAQLKQLGYQVKLQIAGEGEQKQSLIEQTQRLGLEDDVVFLGWISGQQKTEFYQSIDIALVPTMNDTQPLAILDAFAWAKPVVASDHISVQQIIRHNENGLMAKCADVEDLVKQLQFCLDHPKNLARYAEQGYRDALQDYQFSVIAEKLSRFVLDCNTLYQC